MAWYIALALFSYLIGVALSDHARKKEYAAREALVNAREEHIKDILTIKAQHVKEIMELSSYYEEQE